MGIDMPPVPNTIDPEASYLIDVSWYEETNCTVWNRRDFDEVSGQEVLDWIAAGGSCVDGNCLGGCGIFTSQNLHSIVET